MHSLLLLSAMIVVGFALGCADASTEPAGPLRSLGPSFGIEATVRFVPIEGGCWALDTPRGRYEPIGLPPEFRVDGKTVYVTLRPATNAGSYCMLAPLVRIDKIRER